MAPLAPHAGHIGLVLPLCTSAATVGLALYQYPVFMAFLTPDHTGQSIAGKPLSRFWQPMVQRGRVLIAGLAISTTVAGAIASRWLRAHLTLETGNVSKWYIAGTVLAAGHLASLPIIAQPVAKIIAAAEKSSEQDIERTNKEQMEQWLTIHTVRTLLVDLPALVCFAEGVAQSFWITTV